MGLYRLFSRIDFRFVCILLCLMGISLCVISSFSQASHPLLEEGQGDLFFTPMVKAQIRGFAIGWVLFFLFALFDYNKLREYTWFFYLLSLVLLIGLFLVNPIQRVHRWYKLPLVSFNMQPSESAKLAVIIALSWFLEKRSQVSQSLVTAFFAALIVGVPFLLILKQPDLGTALVLFPLSYVMSYFGGLHRYVLRFFHTTSIVLLCVLFVLFGGVVAPQTMKPFLGKFLKEYQYERLSPETYQQKASLSAIALGGISGEGYKQSQYVRGGFLPTPYTDSIFASYAEEFGFVGVFFLLFIYYLLIHRCFQVACVAKDPFGRLLAAGIAAYVAIHVLINIGMMCGFLPITGVPLLLMSYGGSSIVMTMMALGILQSIYIRRFMF